MPPPTAPDYDAIQIDEKKAKEIKTKIQKIWPLFIKKGMKTITRDEAMQILNKILERAVTPEEYETAFVDPDTSKVLEQVKKI